MRTGFYTALLLGSLLLAGCGSDDDDGGKGGSSGSGGSGASGGSAGSGGASGSGGAGATGGSGGSGGTAGGAGAAGSSGAAGSAGAASFSLTSTAYTEGSMIPEKYECTQGGGENVSPPLSWTAGPSGTQSYAIVMRDLDVGFVHWVIWDIPASATSLPEDVEHVFEPSVPAGAKQAPINAGLVGYLGPCSPNSVNTYELTLYAIPTATIAGLGQQSSKGAAEAAIVAAATASATLSGES